MFRYWCPICRCPSRKKPKGVCSTDHVPYVLIPEDQMHIANPEPYRRPEGVSAQSASVEMPMFTSDELHGAAKGMDWAAGRSFDSKSERAEYYKANDLKRTSVKDAQDTGVMQDHPSPTKKYSYSGQKNRDTTRDWTKAVE